jgi:hypothetical protein
VDASLLHILTHRRARDRRRRALEDVVTRNMLLRLQLLVLLAMATAGCELAEGIFKAGMWVGILVVVVIAGLIFMLFGRSRA